MISNSETNMISRRKKFIFPDNFSDRRILKRKKNIEKRFSSENDKDHVILTHNYIFFFSI